jgi:hypothetical protein
MKHFTRRNSEGLEWISKSYRLAVLEARCQRDRFWLFALKAPRPEQSVRYLQVGTAFVSTDGITCDVSMFEGNNGVSKEMFP